MGEDCDNCGATCKKTAGSYQRLCPDCQSPANDYSPHVTVCDKTECEVCHDYLTQTQQWVSYLYTAVQIRKSRQTTQNTRLEQFK